MSVKSTSVFQGIIEGAITHASVQESGRVARQPTIQDEQAHLIRSLKQFEPTIYEAPEGCAFCSHCGEWRRKEQFSPDKRNKSGCDSHCKMCRSEHKRDEGYGLIFVTRRLLLCERFLFSWGAYANACKAVGVVGGGY